jgi:hypothetical protein
MLDMKKVAVDLANEVCELVDPHNPKQCLRVIKRRVECADLVLAVWQNQAEPDGIGMMPVKGDQWLDVIAKGGVPGPLAIAAIPCSNAEQAGALRARIAVRQLRRKTHTQH